MTYITKTLKVSDFLEHYNPGTLTRDEWSEITNQSTTSDIPAKQWTNPPFQRNFVWTEEQQCLFIESLFNKEVYTDIVLVEVNENTREVYDALRNNMNLTSITIDGQHRARTIWNFVTNRLQFTGTIYHNGKGTTYEKHNFSNLPSQIQKRFLNNVDVGIKLITNYSVERLNKIFIKVNEGESLNSQEKRNASPCRIPEWTAVLGETYEELFLKFQGMTPTKILRSSHRERISQILLRLNCLENGGLSLTYRQDDVLVTLNKSKILNNKQADLDKLYNKVEQDNNYISDSIYNYIEKDLLPSFEAGSSVLSSIKNSSDQYMRKFSKSSVEIYTLIHYLIRRKRDVSKSIISDSDLWTFVLQKEVELQTRSEQKEAEEKLQNNAPSTVFFHNECTRMHVSDAFFIVSDAFLKEFDHSIDNLLEAIGTSIESNSKTKIA